MVSGPTTISKCLLFLLFQCLKAQTVSNLNYCSCYGSLDNSTLCRMLVSTWSANLGILSDPSKQGAFIWGQGPFPWGRGMFAEGCPLVGRWNLGCITQVAQDKIRILCGTVCVCVFVGGLVVIVTLRVSRHETDGNFRRRALQQRCELVVGLSRVSCATCPCGWKADMPSRQMEPQSVSGAMWLRAGASCRTQRQAGPGREERRGDRVGSLEETVSRHQGKPCRAPGAEPQRLEGRDFGE